MTEKTRPVLMLDLEFAKDVLKSLYRQGTALAVVFELIERDYCPQRSEIEDAVRRQSEDGNLRRQLAAAIAMVDPA